MDETTIVEFSGRDAVTDPLTDLLRKGARELLQAAVEAERDTFLAEFAERRTSDDRAAVVRSGYHPERAVQTGIGPVTVKVPKVRAKDGKPVTFRSALVPPYVRKAKSIDAALPWLYLKGISTGEMGAALKMLLGPDATGFSAKTVSRLKAQWADGIYSGLRGTDDRLCVLVVIGVNARGEKHFLAIKDGVRESTQSWREVLLSLKSRGLASPKLATGDGAMGFWAALEEICPATRQQRCWMHKTGNVLNYLPKRTQPKAKKMLHDIWQAETREDAHAAFDLFIETFEAKYPKATECLIKDREELLTFYDFPAQHWQSIRTSNPIESAFATIRHRTKRTKGCLSRDGMLHMMFKLGQCAEKSWRKLRGFDHLADVIEGVDFVNGIKSSNQDQAAA
ncbi:transposase, Mutator family (plasmid) [Antarctobacter heliothermus]|uniref:Mutator family transposase n=1 Tax=Antarctobacter heliothermus TaxID=74033 RepID=A0A222EBA2_9RHOB|nr:IS256 family transposase [Antarctobacter heliothermus]ASP23474.1 transposase, Mutator family [Antarctobacter heliothermus]